MFSLNSNNEFPLSCVVYLLLFSYELHRQLGLKDESRHISVMYAVANCHYLSNALPCMCSFEACLSFSSYFVLLCFFFLKIILKCCGSWSGEKQYHAWSSLLSFPISIYHLETSGTFAVTGERGRVYSRCSPCSAGRFILLRSFPCFHCECHNETCITKRVGFRKYPEFTSLAEREGRSALLSFRTMLNLHRNFGLLHLIFFCSHSLLTMKISSPHRISCHKEGFPKLTKSDDRFCTSVLIRILWTLTDYNFHQNPVLHLGS